jgi:hypothetical protein
VTVNGRNVVDVCSRLSCAGWFTYVDERSVRCTVHGVTFVGIDAAAWARP